MSSPDEDLEAFAKARLGTTLRGKYRLDGVVGYGGMAVVFRATHRNQAELAVKVLHPKLARVAGVRERFLREGYAANSVKHKGAVLVVDDDVDDDGSTFLVMELLDGQSCEMIWQRRGGTFPLKAALTVAYEALDVLASAHARGIVHRDVKPANLFVTKTGAVKVLDFGIAKVLDAVSAHSTGRLPIGTPAFMSPEQALGESSDVGPKTDIWAVGATLFSLLSGQLVYDAPTAHEILVKTATQRPPSLASVVPFIAKDVVDLVDGALSVNQDERWSTAAQMRDVTARVHRAIFKEAPSAAGLLELFGGDDVDTANATDETVEDERPPKMSSPPPANRDTERPPPASKRSSGRMRVSPWSEEPRTAPRLSLVLDDTSASFVAPLAEAKRQSPRRMVIPPPTAKRPAEDGSCGPVAVSSADRPTPPGQPAAVRPAAGMPHVQPTAHGQPVPSGAVPHARPRTHGQTQRMPTQDLEPTAKRPRPAWPPPPELGPTQRERGRRRLGLYVGVGAIALVVLAVAAGVLWSSRGGPGEGVPVPSSR